MSEREPDHVGQDWAVTISVDEFEGRTRATARLRWPDGESVGVGLTRINPVDRSVAAIGDELAVARALSDLSRRMMAVTARDIEAVTRQPVSSLR